MIYFKEWEGSSDPDDKSGVAHFKYHDASYYIRLDNIADCNILSFLLEQSFKHGKITAVKALQDRIINTLTEYNTVL